MCNNNKTTTFSVRALMETSIAWGDVGDWVLWKNTWHGCSTVVTLFFLLSVKKGHATTYNNNRNQKKLVIVSCKLSYSFNNLLLQGCITVTVQTLRSLITAVISDPSAPLFITSSHWVVITRAGASARVRSATNTISGLRTRTFISVFDTTAVVAADTGREYPEKKSVQAIRQQSINYVRLIQFFLNSTHIYNLQL